MIGLVTRREGRKHALWGVVLLALTVATGMPSVARSQTLITLNDGQVQGHLNDGTREFLGIPYAAPPVGALRWRPPAAVAPWGGVLAADEYPPACPQLASTPPLAGTASVNEDCLYLNVWTPDPAPTKRLPVMVWLHGGFNRVGSTGDFAPYPPPYDGKRLYDGHTLSAEHDVVVVTLNYRLGVFGFFAHPGLASEDPAYPYAGNQGLLDQRAALEWVRDNIAAFGGDPRKVTIFGESGGAEDVCLHMVSPGSEGLFHRAISQSGTCIGFDTVFPGPAQAIANGVSAAVDCDEAPDQLACLRAKPVADLLATNHTVGRLGFAPVVVDGGFLPGHPFTLFSTGAVAKVPYLLGANVDEGTLFPSAATIETAGGYVNALAAFYGPLFADLIQALAYKEVNFPSAKVALDRVVGDSEVYCPTMYAARLLANFNRRVYVYAFSRSSQIPSLSQLGAFHGAEAPYVFGSVPLPTANDTLLSTQMQSFWTRFAKGRQLRAPKSPLVWPRFRSRDEVVTPVLPPFYYTATGPGYELLRLDAQGDRMDVVKIKDFRRDICSFWDFFLIQSSIP